eukprot:5163094-Pleurochrysis_carterae.AAC.2
MHLRRDQRKEWHREDRKCTFGDSDCATADRAVEAARLVATAPHALPVSHRGNDMSRMQSIEAARAMAAAQPPPPMAQTMRALTQQLREHGRISIDAAELLPKLLGRAGQPYSIVEWPQADPDDAADSSHHVVIQVGDGADATEVELSIMEALLVQLHEPRRKLVVRCLPPALTEAEFQQSISHWDAKITSVIFHPGEQAASARSPPKLGFATLRFRLASAAVDFSAAMDGAPYRDINGFASRIMVEWALCQKVPKEGGKVDSREGTIENDESYLAFVEELEREKEPPMSAEAMLEAKEKQSEKDPVVVITPLMAYLMQACACSRAGRRPLSHALVQSLP